MIRNQRGQSLIEYVILVAMIGVATIATVQHLNHTVNTVLGNVVNKLGGKKAKLEAREFTEQDAKNSDFGAFMRGAQAGDEKAGQ